MTEWFDTKLYREAVEPLMNERMRKRLVNREIRTREFCAKRCALHRSISIIWIICSTIGDGWPGPGLSLADFTAAAHLSVIDYLGALDWRGHKQTKDWYAVMKSRPCFRPLLGRADGGDRPAGSLRQGRFLAAAAEDLIGAAAPTHVAPASHQFRRPSCVQFGYALILALPASLAVATPAQSKGCIRGAVGSGPSPAIWRIITR